MTSNYYKKGREFTENLANEWFVSAGLNSRLNNTIDTSAVDILVDGIKIDVQYSNNYLKYGDFRIDLISAFNFWQSSNNKDNSIFSRDIFEIFESKKNAHIHKKGKYFENPDYLDFVIVFFYNNRLLVEKTPKIVDLNNLDIELIPDYTLIVRSITLIDFVRNNGEHLFDDIRVNDKRKHNIKDKHESAFIPVSVQKIKNNFTVKDYLWAKSLPSPELIKTFFKNEL